MTEFRFKVGDRVTGNLVVNPSLSVTGKIVTFLKYKNGDFEALLDVGTGSGVYVRAESLRPAPEPSTAEGNQHEPAGASPSEPAAPPLARDPYTEPIGRRMTDAEYAAWTKIEDERRAATERRYEREAARAALPWEAWSTPSWESP
jgi:hypothetical protein